MASHRQIEIVAFRMWLERGSPEGSPQVDWEEAVQLLSGPAFLNRTRGASEPSGLRVVNTPRWNQASGSGHVRTPQTA